MAKRSFILYHDQKEVIDELSDEQAGKLFKAIYEYNVNKKIILSGALKVVFIPFKTSFDRDQEKYSEIVEKRSEAGKKGMEKRWDKNKDNKNNKCYQMITNDNKRYQTITNITDNVSVNDSVNVNDNDSVCVINNTPTSDTPNTHDTVFQFCISIFQNYNETDLKKSCKKFFSYYKEKNWKGVNDWKEKLKMWIENDIDEQKIQLKEKEFDDDYVDEAGFHYKNGRRVL